MSIFTPGQATGTTLRDPSPADAAGRLFAIKLLLSQLAGTGGKAQTFGDYLDQGPRGFDQSTIGGLIPGYLQTLSQPGAFQSKTTQKQKPASPSTFQDASSGIMTLLLLNKILGSQGISGITGGGDFGATPLGKVWDWGKSGIWGSDANAPTSPFLSSLIQGDQPGINFTPAPSDTFGSSDYVDPSAWESTY
jgi:hypothetical protein